MARYIDIDETVKTFEKLHGEESSLLNCYNADWIISFLEAQPTADVVQVVRCKDCAHYIEMEGFEYNGRKARSCVWHSALRRENDYCSDAIRKPQKRGVEK